MSGAKKRGRGQPTKLTPQRQAHILERVRAGVPLTRTMASVGIHYQTHLNWMERGKAERERLASNSRAKPRQGEAIYLEYVEALEKALEEAYVRNLTIVQTAAQGGREIDSSVVEEFHPDGTLKSRRTTKRLSQPQWQAAAWYLERRYPEEFARTIKGELTGKDGGPIQGVSMSKEEYQEFLRQNVSRSSHLADLMGDDLV